MRESGYLEFRADMGNARNRTWYGANSVPALTCPTAPQYSPTGLHTWAPMSEGYYVSLGKHIGHVNYHYAVTWKMGAKPVSSVATPSESLLTLDLCNPSSHGYAERVIAYTSSRAAVPTFNRHAAGPGSDGLAGRIHLSFYDGHVEPRFTEHISGSHQLSGYRSAPLWNPYP